jgi:hypothetical protein
MIKRIFLALPLLLTTLPCYPVDFDYYFMGGFTYSRLANSTAVKLNDSLINDYDTITHSNYNPLLGVAVGQTFKNPEGPPLAFGVDLAGYYTRYGVVRGKEHPFVNDGDFDTLDYKFYGRSYAALIEGRLAITASEWQPYALIGLGYTWNRLYDYYENPSNGSLTAATAINTFGDDTTGSMACEVGAGIQKQVFFDQVYNIRYALSLDYRYLNLGKGRLGLAPTQTVANHLQVPNLVSQAITVSLKMTI